MKKNKIITMAIASLLFLMVVSCGSEDTLTPSEPESNPFAQQDADSLLRNKFYQEHGIYLLFNKAETLDLNYHLIGKKDTTNWKMDYYTTSEEKQKAVEFFEKRILPHFAENAKPYAVLLLKDNSAFEWSYDVYDYDWVSHPFVSGWKGNAFALGDLVDMDEDELDEHEGEVKSAIINTLLADASMSEQTKYFEKYSSKYYYNDKADFDVPDGYDDEQAHEFGFLTDSYETYYKGFQADWDEYLKAFANMTEAEFYAEYGNYPLCVAKYEGLKALINAKGYK